MLNGQPTVRRLQRAVEHELAAVALCPEAGVPPSASRTVMRLNKMVQARHSRCQWDGRRPRRRPGRRSARGPMRSYQARPGCVGRARAVAQDLDAVAVERGGDVLGDHDRVRLHRG